MFSVLTSLAPGSVSLRGGHGRDVILGDQGIIRLASGLRRLNTVAGLERIATTVVSQGGSDHSNGEGGDDILLGGHQGDWIDDLDDSNLILGDHGCIDFVRGDPNHTAVDRIESSSAIAYGGDDTITCGAGIDLLSGGTGNDLLDGGDGNDTLIGDNSHLITPHLVVDTGADEAFQFFIHGVQLASADCVSSTLKLNVLEPALRDRTV